jgi:hypothetical protein
MTDINEILKERGERYGTFNGHADISQRFKRIMVASPSWQYMTDSQREAMEMIGHKLARILNGDPAYVDSWSDAAGYAQLVVKQLEGENP